MPAHGDALVIPLAITLLLVGTAIFVSAVALLARAADRLIDLVIAARPGRAGRQREAGGTPARRRRHAAVPRTVLAALLAAGLVFALAWSAFVLGRVRDLG